MYSFTEVYLLLNKFLEPISLCEFEPPMRCSMFQLKKHAATNQRPCLRESSDACCLPCNRKMRTYMGREIAPVLPCNEHSEAWLSREDRWIEEQPELLLNALSLRRSMKVADVGAGTGFMTVQLARRVGSRGLLVLDPCSSFCPFMDEPSTIYSKRNK